MDRLKEDKHQFCTRNEFKLKNNCPGNKATESI